MIFLKIYFCVFTTFLNNVSIRTVKDKTRGAGNLAVRILECDCLDQPWAPFPEFGTDCVSLGGLAWAGLQAGPLLNAGQANGGALPLPVSTLPLFHWQLGPLAALVEARLLCLSHLFMYLTNTWREHLCYATCRAGLCGV